MKRELQRGTCDEMKGRGLEKLEKQLNRLNEIEKQNEALRDKVQAFEKWLALGTPFESAKFDHKKVLEEYRKLFSDVLIPRKETEVKP